MRALITIVALAGCGRLGFSEHAEPDAADRDGAIADAAIDPTQLEELCGTTDTDGDGVGDACDPSDLDDHHVVLIETFPQAPTGWVTTGAAEWTITAGGLHAMYTDPSASSYVAPIVLDPPLALRIAYTIEGLNGASSNHTISVVDAFDLVTEDSQKCGQASPSRASIGHEMAGTTVDASNVAFADSLMPGVTYVTTFDHGATNMRCATEVPAIGPTATVSVQHAPWRTSGKVGVRIRSIAATFHSLLVIAPN